MITTLDAQPQEWMEGDENVFHTIAACHFQNQAHIDHWIKKLIPKNKDGKFVKWSGGRRTSQTRDEFINKCITYSKEIDFQVSCISTSEGQMSWFAQAFYIQNQNLVTQKLDNKSRNCLIFKITDTKEISFPVLRAGYLIWYHHVVRYLADFKKIQGKLLSDNFACDEEGPGEGKATGVSFVNFLLAQCKSDLRVSLPITGQYKEYDRLSDYFCGWVNSIRTGSGATEHKHMLEELEASPNSFLDCVIFQPDFQFINEYGVNVTQEFKNEIANSKVNG